MNAIHDLGHLCIKVGQLSLSTRLEEGEEVWLDLGCGLQVENATDNIIYTCIYSIYISGQQRVDRHNNMMQPMHMYLQTQDKSLKLTQCYFTWNSRSSIG